MKPRRGTYAYKARALGVYLGYLVGLLIRRSWRFVVAIWLIFAVVALVKAVL